jgi:hypothetical protein
VSNNSEARVNTGKIQDGNWHTDTDCVSNVNQEFCWDAGDTLGWGKVSRRAETSALWTTSLWKASPCHDLLTKPPALHAKPHPIGRWSHRSTGHELSDPPACSSSRPDLCSTGPLDLCGATPLRPARLVIHRPARSALEPCHSGLPGS